MSDEQPRIVLTDAPPLPQDERCPRCGAGPDDRKVYETYRAQLVVCVCGHVLADNAMRY